MKRTISVLAAALAMAVSTVGVWAAGGTTATAYGAAAAQAAIKAGTTFTVTDMLRWAAEDEYLAKAEYTAIIARFGAIRPYTNIMQAEEQHLSWLRTEYQNRKLAFPADGAAGHIVVPSDLRAAAQAGVDAEIGNIAMYEAFLARPEMAKAENAAVKSLFEQLKRASENHLKAFKTQLAKY